MLTAEYQIPTHIAQLIAQNKVAVKLLPTNDKWFGMTYHEDKATVKKAIAQLTTNGIYQEELFSDFGK